MGEKITPSTPVRVKSGRKATAMMRVEKAIGPPTSVTASTSRSSRRLSPGSARWRKQFSITITVESMMIPKSTAPSEMRLAGVAVSTMKRKATSSASGMLRAVMRAARRLPRNKSSTTTTSSMPSKRL